MLCLRALRRLPRYRDDLSGVIVHREAATDQDRWDRRAAGDERNEVRVGGGRTRRSGFRELSETNPVSARAVVLDEQHDGNRLRIGLTDICVGDEPDGSPI